MSLAREPNRPVACFDDGPNPEGAHGITGQPAALPVRDISIGTHPETPVLGGKQRDNRKRQRLPVRGGPWRKSDPIKADQRTGRPNPDKTVLRLCDSRKKSATEVAFSALPARVCILGHPLGRVE